MIVNETFLASLGGTGMPQGERFRRCEVPHHNTQLFHTVVILMPPDLFNISGDLSADLSCSHDSGGGTGTSFANDEHTLEIG